MFARTSGASRSSAATSVVLGLDAVRERVALRVLARHVDRLRIVVDRDGTCRSERDRREREDPAAAAHVDHELALDLGGVRLDRARDEACRLVEAGAERATRLELEDLLAGLRLVRLPRRAHDEPSAIA